MWLLPTRGRPDDCSRLIWQMTAVQDMPEVAVFVDDDKATYQKVNWPSHWHVYYGEEHMEMVNAVNYLYKRCPNEKFYGVIGDHFRPLTKWSQALVEAAGDWFISWPEDNYVSHYQISAAMTFGGKLVNEMGWVFLPTQIHIATELPWRRLVFDLHNGRRVRKWNGQEVRVTHDKTELNGRPLDANRNRIYKGQNFNDTDALEWVRWEKDHATAVKIDSIKMKMKEDGIIFRGNAIDASYHTDDCGLPQEFLQARYNLETAESIR